MRSDMKPEVSSFCKGQLAGVLSEFIRRSGEKVIAIQESTAWICQDCGEDYHTSSTSKKIDSVISKVKRYELPLHPLMAGETRFSEVVSPSMSTERQKSTLKPANETVFV